MTRGTRQVGRRPGADNRKRMAQLNRGRDAPINPDWKRRGAGVGLRFVRATTCRPRTDLQALSGLVGGTVQTEAVGGPDVSCPE